MHRPPFGPSESALHVHMRAPVLEFEFSEHTIQGPPACGLYLPTGHAVQFVPPSTEDCPAAHFAHVVLLSAATLVEYVPIEQFVQYALPFVVLYVPAGQATHGPPFGPVYPVLHRQFVMSPLRSGAAEFAGHTVHFALACGAYSPAAHIAHVVLLSAATLAEYVPTEQLVHAALPFEALCVPGRQALHWPFEVPLSGPVYPELHEHCMLGAATGRLFSAQQSVEFTVPTSDLYPAGHCVHTGAPLAFANVSGAQDEHDVVASASWY